MPLSCREKKLCVSKLEPPTPVASCFTRGEKFERCCNLFLHFYTTFNHWSSKLTLPPTASYLKIGQSRFPLFLLIYFVLLFRRFSFARPVFSVAFVSCRSILLSCSYFFILLLFKHLFYPHLLLKKKL